MNPEFGAMTAEQKRSILKDILKQKAQAASSGPAAPVGEIEYDLSRHPGYRRVAERRMLLDHAHVSSPYFKSVESWGPGTVMIDGHEYVNFATSSYLDLIRHPGVCAAAKEAIDRNGPTVSASRLVSGTCPLHLELERTIAEALRVPESICFGTGFQANLSTIPCLLGPNDIVLHDALVHNSCLQGCILSMARRLPFPHNDWAALDSLLAANRNAHPRALILIEGVYSMDGDMPDLPRFIEVAKRHRAYLMVDEAHSFGVLGRRGFGIGEEFDVPPDDVDIWMGTLDKSMAGYGGYIAGSHALVENLRWSAPGFLYSVALPPPTVAAALASFGVMREEPERLVNLRARSRFFLNYARERGLNTGLSQGICLVPIILKSSGLAVMMSNALFEAGIYAAPIIHPAVEENAARLRFFIQCSHTEEQIRYTVDTLAAQLRRLGSQA
jgi:8-amino-7-oxononanoate synthase